MLLSASFALEPDPTCLNPLGKSVGCMLAEGFYGGRKFDSNGQAAIIGEIVIFVPSSEQCMSFLTEAILFPLSTIAADKQFAAELWLVMGHPVGIRSPKGPTSCALSSIAV